MKRKLEAPGRGVVEVQQSLEPLLQVRSGAGATLSPSGAWAALEVLALPAPSTARPLLQVFTSAQPVAQDMARDRTCPRELSGVSRCG